MTLYMQNLSRLGSYFPALSYHLEVILYLEKLFLWLETSMHSHLKAQDNQLRSPNLIWKVQPMDEIKILKSSVKVMHKLTSLIRAPVVVSYPRHLRLRNRLWLSRTVQTHHLKLHFKGQPWIALLTNQHTQMQRMASSPLSLMTMMMTFWR